MTGQTTVAAVDRAIARGGARLEGRAGWLAPVALLIWVAVLTRTWGFPDQQGLPFTPLWAAAVAFGVAVVTAVRRGQPGPFEVLAAIAFVTMALYDLTIVPTQVLRDLHLYLKAGEHWLAGGPVYLDRLLTVVPPDRSDYPFLYPPPTLPFFGALALLPRPLVDVAWTVGSAAAAVVALKGLGMPLRWAVAALLWPPFVQGLWVGNVAVPLFVLFVLGPRFGAGLVVSAAFKAYSAIAALWLVVERRWVALAVGLAIVASAALLTLPLVGLDRWREWLAGLSWYTRSQPYLPQYLYGFGLGRYLPEPIALAIGGGAVIVALASAGEQRLARLGTATVIASPSLFAHGFLVAIPSLLGVGLPWLWLLIAFTSISPEWPWFFALLVVAAAWILPSLRRPDGYVAPRGIPDPLAGGPAPWATGQPAQEAGPG